MAIATESAEYVGITEASRRVGRSAAYVLKMVARGLVKTQNDPGFTPRYNADDLDVVRKRYAAR